MSLTLIAFISFVAVVIIGTVSNPLAGIIGYMGVYCVGPESQWWHAPLNGFALRYSFTFGVLTAISICLNRHKLQFKQFFTSQEKLMLLFVCFIWLSKSLTEDTVGRYGDADHPAMKMTKIIFFLILMSHVVTDIKKGRIVIWTLIISSLILGLQAYDAPSSAFSRGRLENIGGADFSDANRFAGFMASMLFIIGAQFLRSGWRGKLVCFVSGGFVANAVVLARSRGALLGIAGGMLVALILAPKKYRMKIVIGIILAGFGMFYLTDPQMLNRASTITANDDERDSSAQSRLEIWAGGVRMLINNPLLGAGPGNFYQNIGRYQPLHPGRDAHNTFVRCGGELGFIGLLLFILILLNAARIFIQCIRGAPRLPSSIKDDISWLSYGCLTCMAAMLTYGMTGTLVYTEYLWWMLALSACMQRVFENELTEEAGRPTVVDG